MNASHRDLQIFAPELLTRTERARDTVFTALMWGFYLYLWVPLVSLFAWLLGFEFAYEVMVRAGGAEHLAEIVWIYGSIVVVIFIVVTVWSLHNRLSYGHLSRRKAIPVVSAEAMAEYFHVDPGAIQRLQQMPSASINFDAEGHPIIAELPAPN